MPDTRFRIDRTVNLSGLLSAVFVIWSIWQTGNRIVAEIRLTEAKTNIMWVHFLQSNQITNEERAAIISLDSGGLSVGPSK